MQSRSTTYMAWRRFIKNKSGVFGLVLLLVMMGFAAWVTLTQPFPTTKVLDASLMPLEDPNYLLGTDIAGRDMARLLAWGIRTSIVIALATEALIMVASLILGFLSGWFGGVVDFFITRIIEVFVSIPPLLFQPLFIILMGATIPNLVLAIGALSWTEPTRIVRAQTMHFRDREFINASRALGAGTPRIALYHMLPNILNPFIIAITINIPAIILTESTLSFLGYGLTESNPSLGKMIGVSYQYIQAYWHMALLPTACLSLLMLGISLFGDGLRDAIDTQS